MAVIVAAAVAACGGEEKPDALLASAKTYLEKKESKAAVIQLKTALQQQPDFAEARLLLGQTLLDTGDAVGAEVELRKARDLKVSDDRVVPLLARSLLLQNKGQRVLDELGSVELREPAASAELNTAIATAYEMKGDTTKATAALDAALKDNPDFSSALLMRARNKAAQRDFDAAFQLVDHAIAKNPKDYQALQFKGDLLYVLKHDADGALALHRKSLAEREDWVPAHASILEIMFARRDMEGAQAQLAALQKLLPNHPQTRYYQARVAFLKEDYKRAKELVQPLVGAAPNNFNVLMLAAAIEMQTGSLAQAETYATGAMQRSPSAGPARLLLARILLRSGQVARVEQVLAPLLEEPSVGSDALQLAGQAALQSGDIKGAESYFARASKANPDDAASRTAVALTQFSRGNADAGFDQLEQIAAADKGTIADMAIISARLRQRDYAGAMKAIDGLERKQPGKPLPPHLRGQVQVSQNNIPAARKSFEQALAADPTFFPAVASLAALDLRDKKPDEARKRFEELRKRDPKNVNVLLALAEIRSQGGASKEELAGLLADAIKAHPTSVTPRTLLVQLHMRAKDNKQALTVAQEGVAALPDSPEMLDALGRAQVAAGEARQAVTTFNKLTSLQRGSPEPYMRLADTHVLLKDNAAARESLARALEVAPRHLPAQRGLILLDLAEKKPEQAMARARAIQNERQGQPVGYLLAGDIQASQRDWTAAAASYRAALKQGPTTEGATKLYDSLVAGQKRPEAESFASSWVKEHPTDWAFRGQIAERALTRSEFPIAEAHYTAIVNAQPNNAIALNNLAWITNRMKKPGAAALAERALALQPDQPSFNDTLATILADAGDYKKALEYEKKALAGSPQNSSFKLNLAKLYMKVGDKAQAKTHLDDLARLGDRFPAQQEVNELAKAL
nr:XrtA/PEP-CTERM system TPR-repeat protein PrsT [Schlegelella koreensis]